MKRCLLALAIAAASLGALAPGASAACATMPSARDAPYLVSPCTGATVKAHSAITFTVFDRDPAARAHGPYLSLALADKVVGGRLAPTLDGDGIFHALAPVAGKPDLWTYTAASESYPSWWDNRAGTYYVQVQQLDDRPANGTYVSSIVAIHVR